ncbi:MAG: hypothetical protein US86_C0013G0013 [Candidatus Daviesbacteria bacterium GW2011_GWA2_38_24]|uniref:Uncharacterized protein n=1 Tax=Candidatus Daviesbacteria bacterium GW2011_GWA2_38_24 TaxID=1618422 RepID=A0A0G0JE79_9BACT|nr:MAG: hypothetical protein US86_C0013G0013 [Candidatus Daviesbacteria bacterium GW2011_GWA2_38_24]KKQ79875.1 MAG: hypothetical protein UT01_C0025G0008 [Candidatus Daviesbacteria bacterium GW2011_GWA1_38_7]
MTNKEFLSSGENGEQKQRVPGGMDSTTFNERRRELIKDLLALPNYKDVLDRQKKDLRQHKQRILNLFS